jgi:hypothetical protein
MTRDAFCLQETLRRIRWPLQPRSHDRATAFGDVATAGWHSRATLGLAPDLARLSGEADSRRSLRRALLPTVSPADPSSRLGPRSLDPDRSFWSAYAELIWDQRSPADFCNETRRASNQPGLSISSLGRRPRPPSGSYATRPLPCGSGATRRAALRPNARPQCWFLPLSWVCPTVMPKRSPHHEDAFGVPCIVRIDAHGSKDRAKDASTGAHATISRACAGAYA